MDIVLVGHRTECSSRATTVTMPRVIRYCYRIWSVGNMDDYRHANDSRILIGIYECLVGGPQYGIFLPRATTSPIPGIIRHPARRRTRMAAYTYFHLYWCDMAKNVVQS